MKPLFWLLVAIDAAALALLFVLGLAAATSTKTSPFAVAGSLLVIPGLILVAAVVLFTRGGALARSAAVLMAATPLLLLTGMSAFQSMKLRANTTTSGEMAYFPSGTLRDIAAAIAQNDTATVSRLVPTVNVNKRGYRDVTLLILALRQLAKTPVEPDVLRILLAAHADPNLSADESPLEVAMQGSRYTGAKPVEMLLAAGANPNARGMFGEPVFFSGVGITMPPEVIAALIQHGADLKATDRDGRTIVFQAANASNWRAVLLLLERGVDYKSGRTVNGETFNTMVESYARTFGDTAGVAEVVNYLKQH